MNLVVGKTSMAADVLMECDCLLAGAFSTLMLEDDCFSGPGLKEISSIKTGLDRAGALLLTVGSAGAEAFFRVLQLAAKTEMQAKMKIRLIVDGFNSNIGRTQDSKYIAKCQAPVDESCDAGREPAQIFLSTHVNKIITRCLRGLG